MERTAWHIQYGPQFTNAENNVHTNYYLVHQNISRDTVNQTKQTLLL